MLIHKKARCIFLGEKCEVIAMKTVLYLFTLLFGCILPTLGQAGDEILFSKEEHLTPLLKEYSEDDQREILKDLKLVEELCFSGCHPAIGRAPIYLATAGAPGARKSTILETILHNEPAFHQCVYLDPDQRALKWMVHTYYNTSLTAFNTKDKQCYPLLQKEAYNTWRSASNFIANSLLEKALQGHYDIAHGTTMTGQHIARLMDIVKKQGYTIILALCGAEDETRARAILYRNEVQGFYQATPEDVREKGKLFPQRFPIYFAKADEMRLYWSDAFDSPERLCAVLKKGKIEVFDKVGYDRFVDKYNRDRAAYTKQTDSTIPSWQECLNQWKSRS